MPTVKFLLTALMIAILAYPVHAAVPEELAAAVSAESAAAGIPGSVILLQNLGEEPQIYTHGLSDITTGDPVRPDSLFRIGSITKTYMAVLTLKLASGGHLDLDDPITDYLPESRRWFGHITDPARITVRDLLQHTSGLPDYVEILAELPPILQQILSEHDWRQVELPEIIHKREALFPPGEGCSYTNTGYTVLGLLIERAVGRPLDELCHEYIFYPLGLDDTYYAALEETPPQAHAYLLTHGELIDVTMLDMPQVAGTAGCILTDADDLAAFAMAVFSEGFLTDSEWVEMSSFKRMSKRTEYGLGLMKRTYKGHMYYGHGGETLGYRAAMYWFPEEELLVIGFANLGYSEVERALYAAIDLELGLE